MGVLRTLVIALLNSA